MIEPTACTDHPASAPVTDLTTPACSIVLTGFGEFAGVADNPTSDLIHCFTKMCASTQATEPESSGTESADYHIAHLEVLDVSTIGVEAFFAAFTCSQAAKKIRFVHLGVDARATCMKIEKAAWNNMTFRVPDQKGFQPENALIDEGLPLEAALQSKLPLDELVASMRGKGCNVETSQDPGRFICNYIYYRSQQYCTTGDMRSKRIDAGSVFVHVPPFSVISQEDQLEYIKTILAFLSTN